MLFFGLYHRGDYKRFLWHKGPKIVFWCGSDILQLGGLWQKLIAKQDAIHVCENEVEQEVLAKKGINAQIQPMFFGNPDYFPLYYKYKPKSHVYLNVHPGREEEYGLLQLPFLAERVPDVTFHVYGDCIQVANPRIIYHGQVPEDQFNSEIRQYQAALRLNKFDGFSDILAKSVLLGQWPISVIKYPHITHTPDMSTLLKALNKLKYKSEPNKRASEYWRQELTKPLLF